MKKTIQLFLLMLFISFSVSSQDNNFPYSEKDYLFTMNEVVEAISDLYNHYSQDTSISKRLIDLSNNEIYVLSLGFMDGHTTASYAINKWFIPKVHNLSIDAPTKVRVVETDLDKWGIWFRIQVTNLEGLHYIDLGINKENKISSIIF